MFRVGQKVICVDDWQSKFPPYEPCPLTRGRIYTVTKSWLYKQRHPVVLVAEIKKPKSHCGFDATRFRPIVDRKTDISIFTEMLKPNTPKVEKKPELVW